MALIHGAVERVIIMDAERTFSFHFCAIGILRACMSSVHVVLALCLHCSCIALALYLHVVLAGTLQRMLCT
jgi:hypothetical protein